MSLARLVHTLPLEADASLSARRPLHGGKLLGQADHLALANDGTPKAGTHVHSGADSVLGSEGESTLAHGVIALSWEFLRAQQGLTGRVQEALGCIRERGKNNCLKSEEFSSLTIKFSNTIKIRISRVRIQYAKRVLRTGFIFNPKTKSLEENHILELC